MLLEAINKINRAHYNGEGIIMPRGIGSSSSVDCSCSDVLFVQVYIVADFA